MEYLGTVLILILVIMVAIIYNALMRARNKVKEEYSNMDVSLKQRWDLIPNLVETVKGYSAFEETILEKLTTLRTQEYKTFQMHQKLSVDSNISKVLFKMMAIAENYPDLKADAEYLKLSEQLTNLEEEIANNRKNYNKAVKEYNTKIETIPDNIVAILFGFNEEPFFEISDEEKENVKIDL